MPSDPEFAVGLFRGTAQLYDQFRLPYATQLINRLLEKVGPTADGRALDLGCGTGQLAFRLAEAFGEVWAADPEQDMISVVRSKIAAGGIQNVHPVIANAQDLEAPPETFELIVIGNAFHRMPRQQVADRAGSWLAPGGHLALCWSSPPWIGAESWKRVFSDLLGDWQHRLDAVNRIPANLAESRTALPDETVLQAAGFTIEQRYQVTVGRDWTTAALAGFSYTTSFLPITVFGDRTAEFEADLAERLQPYLTDSVLTDGVSYAYDLFSLRAPADT